VSIISLRPEVGEALQIIARSDRAPQSVAKRAVVILALDATQSVSAASRLSGMARSGVWKWLSFWHQRQHELIDLFSHKLVRHLASVLSERHPPGHTAKFTPEQVAGILALACEPANVADTPMPQWTLATLAEEAVRREIVPAISPATVARFLKSGRAKAPQGRSLAEPA
jgi:putative transposase